MKKRWLLLSGLVALSVGIGVTARMAMAQSTIAPYVPGLDFKASAGGTGQIGWKTDQLRLERCVSGGVSGLTFRVGAGDRASGKGTAETPFTKIPFGSFTLLGQARGNLQFNPSAELYVVAKDKHDKVLKRIAVPLVLTPGQFVPEDKTTFNTFSLSVLMPPDARKAYVGVALKGSGFVTLRQIKLIYNPIAQPARPARKP